MDHSLRDLFFCFGATKSMEAEGEERQWSSLIVPSVLEIVKEKNFTTVPPRYVRPDQEKTEILNDSSLSSEIPVIDMKRLCSVSAMDSELKKLDFACQDWGFFQVSLFTHLKSLFFS